MQTTQNTAKQEREEITVLILVFDTVAASFAR